MNIKTLGAVSRFMALMMTTAVCMSLCLSGCAVTDDVTDYAEPLTDVNSEAEALLKSESYYNGEYLSYVKEYDEQNLLL